MTTIYCTWDTSSGGSLSLELEVLKADIAGGRGFDKQHRVDRWIGECAGVGDRRSPGTRPAGAFMVDRNRSPGNGLGRRAGEGFNNLKRVGDA